VSSDRGHQSGRHGRDKGAVNLLDIYDRSFTALYNYCYYRLGKDHHAAEEAVQETFALAVERVGLFNPQRGDAFAWLCSLSRNVIRRERRFAQRTINLAEFWGNIDEELKGVYSRLESMPLPAEVVEMQETRDLVTMAMAQLPGRYRDVLEGKYVNALSVKEIARRLTVTPKTVESLLTRAREAFRQTMGTMVAAIECA
jgi:RNA polymerase sigma-70 factor (ECF subfamily)